MRTILLNEDRYQENFTSFIIGSGVRDEILAKNEKGHLELRCKFEELTLCSQESSS